MPAAGGTAVIRPRVASKKNIKSVQKYNNILEEAKQLARIASQDKLVLFDKLENLLRYLIPNIHN